MATLSFNTLKKTDVTWLPLIPEHWELIKVRHLFKESTKKGFPNEPLLVASQKHGVVSKDAYGKRTVEATKDLHNLKLVEVGDYVISLRSFQGGIELAYERGIISPAYTVMKETKIIDRRYFKNLFKSPPFISLMTLCVKGIREGQNIDYPTFKNEYLPFPPIGEQKAIAEYLDKKNNEIDKFIRNKEKLIELLEESRRRKILNAITKGLNKTVKLKFSGIEWFGSVPEHWVVTRVKYVSKVFVPDRNKPELNIEKDGIPWVTTETIGEEILDLKLLSNYVSRKSLNTKENRVLSKNSLVATCVGSFGISSYITFECFINQQLQAYTELKINPFYLRFMIQSSEPYFNKNATQTTLMYVNKQIFAELPILFPQIDEQNIIISFLKNEIYEIDLAISKAQQEIASIKEYRVAVITDLVTGKRSIPQIQSS